MAKDPSKSATAHTQFSNTMHLQIFYKHITIDIISFFLLFMHLIIHAFNSMLTLNQAMAPLQGVSILIKEHY